MAGYSFSSYNKKEKNPYSFFQEEGYVPNRPPPSFKDLVPQQQQQPDNNLNYAANLATALGGKASPESPAAGMGLSPSADEDTFASAEGQLSQQPQKTGPYDYWKQPVVGNMPLDRFVQLTGMAAHAFAPQEASGRLGASLAGMGGQAAAGRLGYEEREAEKTEQRAGKVKEYEQARQQKMADRFVALATNANIPKQMRATYAREFIKVNNKLYPEFQLDETMPVTDDITNWMKASKAIGARKDMSPDEKYEAQVLCAVEYANLPPEKALELLKKTEKETFGTEQPGPRGTTRQVSSRGRISTITKPEKAERGPKITPNVAVNPATNKNEYLMTDGSFSGQVAGVKPRAEKAIDPATAAVMKALGIDVGGAEQTPATGGTKDRYGYTIGEVQKGHKYLGNDKWQKL